jgi:hypothetical protein
VVICHHLYGVLNLLIDTVPVVEEAYVLPPSTGPEDEVVIHVMGSSEGLVSFSAKLHFLGVSLMEVSNNWIQC